MMKDDSKLIWEAFISERRNPDADTYDAEGELPGPVAELNPDEEEEGPTSNLDSLIAMGEDNEDDDVLEEPGKGATAAQFKAANATGFG